MYKHQEEEQDCGKGQAADEIQRRLDPLGPRVDLLRQGVVHGLLIAERPTARRARGAERAQIHLFDMNANPTEKEKKK